MEEEAALQECWCVAEGVDDSKEYVNAVTRVLISSESLAYHIAFLSMQKKWLKVEVPKKTNWKLTC